MLEKRRPQSASPFRPGDHLAAHRTKIQVTGGAVKLSVVDFNKNAKPGYGEATIGQAQVGAWTTVNLSPDFTGFAPDVSGSINGGAPSAVIPFVPSPSTYAGSYRIEMTLGTYSILGGTNAVDLDDVDVRPR